MKYTANHVLSIAIPLSHLHQHLVHRFDLFYRIISRYLCMCTRSTLQLVLLYVIDSFNVISVPTSDRHSAKILNRINFSGICASIPVRFMRHLRIASHFTSYSDYALLEPFINFIISSNRSGSRAISRRILM